MIARVLAAALTATVLLAQTPISKETPTPTAPSVEKEIQEEQQPELGELGNPRSSFKLGSAKYLEGKNLVYSLFVDTPDAKWSDKEKQEVLENLKIAEEYIETAARDYRKKVDLVVDFKENPSLTGTGKIYFSVKDGKDYEERLDREIAKWLDTKVSYEELLEEHKAKGIAMVVFLIIKVLLMPYAMMEWIIRRKALLCLQMKFRRSMHMSCCTCLEHMICMRMRNIRRRFANTYKRHIHWKLCIR